MKRHRPPAKPSRKAVRAYLRMMGATDAQLDATTAKTIDRDTTIGSDYRARLTGNPLPSSDPTDKSVWFIGQRSAPPHADELATEASTTPFVEPKR